MSAHLATADGGRPIVRPDGLAIPALPLAWSLVLVTAFWLRLGALDAVPLAPDEAAWALEGRAIWHGQAGDYHSQPLLPNLLAVWFFLFTAADGPARAPSALAGAALCLTPLLFADRIGRWAALAAGLLLAFSPLSVLASRTVQPAALAMLATAVAVGALFRALAAGDGRWLLATGLSLGLGLGSGRVFVGQLMALALAFAIVPPLRAAAEPTLRAWAPRAALVGIIGAVLFDTLLLTRPGGVQAGLIDPFPAWLGSIGVGRASLFAGGALGLHEVALLLLGGYGAVVAPERRLAWFLVAWAGAATLLALLVRTPDLGAFVAPVLPLALLAGIGVTRLQWLEQARRTAVWVSALAALLPVIFCVFVLNGAVQRGGPFSFTPVALAAGGLVAVVLVAGAWLERREVAVALAAALGVVAAALWLTSLTRLNYAGFQRGGPALLGQSSRSELYEVTDRVFDWWRQDPSGPVQVDASLRPVLEWALRDGPPIQWTTKPPDAPQRAILGGLIAASRPPDGWIRLVVAERYPAPNAPGAPAALWRWFILREPLARSEPHAILLPQ